MFARSNIAQLDKWFSQFYLAPYNYAMDQAETETNIYREKPVSILRFRSRLKLRNRDEL